MDKRWLQIEVLDDVMIELMRHKTPWELTVLQSRMFSLARDRIRAYLQHIHPDWNDTQIHDELFRRIHGSA